MRKNYLYRKVKHEGYDGFPGHTTYYMRRGDKAAELRVCDDMVDLDYYGRKHIAEDLWQLRRELREPL